MEDERDILGNGEGAAVSAEERRLEALLSQMPRRRAPARIRENVLAALRAEAEQEIPVPQEAPKAEVVSLWFRRRILRALQAAAVLAVVVIGINLYFEIGPQFDTKPTSPAPESPIEAKPGGEPALKQPPLPVGAPVSGGSMKAGPVRSKSGPTTRDYVLGEGGEESQREIADKDRILKDAPDRPAVDAYKKETSRHDFDSGTIPSDVSVPFKSLVESKRGPESGADDSFAMNKPAPKKSGAAGEKGVEKYEAKSKSMNGDEAAAADRFAPLSTRGAAAGARRRLDRTDLSEHLVGGQFADDRAGRPAEEGGTPLTAANGRASVIAGAKTGALPIDQTEAVAGPESETRELRPQIPPTARRVAINHGVDKEAVVEQAVAGNVEEVRARPARTPAIEEGKVSADLADQELPSAETISHQFRSDDVAWFEIQASPVEHKAFVDSNSISSIEIRSRTQRASQRADEATTWVQFHSNAVAAFNDLVNGFGGSVNNTEDVVVTPGDRRGVMVECTVPDNNGDALIETVNQKRMVAVQMPSQGRFGGRGRGSGTGGVAGQSQRDELVQRFRQEQWGRWNVQKVSEIDLSEQATAALANFYVQIPPPEQNVILLNRLGLVEMQDAPQFSSTKYATSTLAAGLRRERGHSTASILSIVPSVITADDVASPSADLGAGYAASTGIQSPVRNRLLFFVLEPDEQLRLRLNRPAAATQTHR